MPGSYFTDEELLRLAKGGLTEDELASLEDDEIRRIGVLNARKTPASDLALQGKPTLEQSERAQRVADTPRVTKPTRTIPGPPIEEPFTIEGMLKSIGKTAAGDRPDVDDTDNFKTPSWERLAARSSGQPETITNQGDALRKQQDKILAGGQPMVPFLGPKPASPEESEMVQRIAGAVLKESVDSLTQFVTHPMQQLAERPGEFGMNLVGAGFELAGPLARSGKIVTEATEAARLGRLQKAAAVRAQQGEDAVSRVARFTEGFEEKRVAPEARAAFEREFKTRLADAEDALRANEAKMSPAQYKAANQKIEDLVKKRLRSETSDPVPEGLEAARQSATDDVLEAALDPGAEAELERKLDAARRTRPALARHGEATPEQLVDQAADAAKAEARAKIANATPEEVRATNQLLETKLDEIAELKEANRAAGGDPVVMAKLRGAEAAIEGSQQAISDVRATVDVDPGPFGTGDVVRHPASGKTYTVESVDIRPGGKTIVNVQDSAGNASRFTEDALEITDEAPHVPPGIQVPNTLEEWSAFHGTIPDAKATPEELVRLAANKAIPGHEVVAPPPPKGTKITTSDGITYEFQSEMKGAKGKPPIRYWKADKPMPDGGGKAGSMVSEDVIQRNGLVVPRQAPDPPPVPSATAAEPVGSVSAATEMAQGSVKLTDVLSTAPLGGMLLAGLQQDDEEDPTPKQGSPLALKHALWAIPGGILAYGVARYFRSPEFRTALLRFTSIDKTGPADLERVFETAIMPLLPDIPANGLAPLAPAVGTAAGALAGAAVGSDVGQDEAKPGGALFGLLTGAVVGRYAGGSFQRQFRTPMTFRQLYRAYFTEAAGMSASALEAKHVTRVALEGRIREIKDVAEQLDSFNESTRGAIQAWMSGNANILTVPEKARPAAEAARRLFDGLSMDLLKSGLVRNKVLRDTIQTNIGKYVPRLLLRYELDDPREIVESWLRGQGKGWGYISNKDYLKAKKNIPPDVLKALGEITDNPGYLLAKRGTITAADIEQARYHRFLLASPENAIPANLLRAQRRAAKAGAAAQPPQVRLYSAEGGMKAAEWQGRTYWQMPDNPRYGLVRGRYLEQAVASDIISTHETTSGLQKFFDTGTSIFKYHKAVMNPASQFRNMASNTIFADVVAGIPPWRMDLWTRGLNDLRSKGKWYQSAVRDGAFGGEFTAAEIGDLLLPEVQNATSMFEVMGNAIPKYANKGSEFFTRWHQGSEAWARMTVYRHGVEKLGMTGSQAASFARRTIPDYQDVPRWLKVVRKSPFGAPFISFSYKALPRILESATAFGDPRRMMRFWKYPLAFAALNEYSAQKLGTLGKDESKDIFGTLRRTTLRTLSAGNYSPDSYDTFRKYLPGHVGKMQIAIPWRDQYDRVQYLDGTYFLPWGDAGEMGKGEGAKGTGLGWFPRQLEPTNPWFQLGVAAMTGKDSFTGRDIAPAGSVGIEHIAGWAHFLSRSWGPSLLNPAGYSAEALTKAFSGNFEGDPYVKSRGTAVAGEIVGRIRPVDPSTAFRFKWFEFKKELDANKSEIRRLAPELMRAEDLSMEEMTAIVENRQGSKALQRAVRRRMEMTARFLKQYPPDDLPPSPEKLIDAIQRQYKQ